MAEIIVADGNFHGRTTTIVGFSSEKSYKDGFGPFSGGFIEAKYCWSECGMDESIKSFESKINKNTCAILIEPIQGEAGIRVPEESTVNYKEVAQCFLKETLSNGGSIRYNSKVIEIEDYRSNSKRLKLSSGEFIEANIIIAASGLYSDKLAKLLKININNQQIIPFRGEYYKFKDDTKNNVEVRQSVFSLFSSV